MAALPAEFWRRLAARTARRHNAACVLGEFIPWTLGLNAAFACALLIAREHNAAGPSLWLAYGAATLACLEIALRRARPRFFTVSDALVRLEVRLGLHNRLSAAAAGVGPYPAPLPAAEDGFAFRWPRIALPLAGAGALVALAACLPLARAAATYRPPADPLAWAQTAAWIDALKKTDAVQEPALEELRERLEQLRNQPAQDWYSQSSLEAGDSLHTQTAQSMEALRRDLQTALGDLGAMERFTSETSAAEAQAAHESLANALKGLALGNLPLNSELLSKLKDADLSTLKSLSPAQLASLKERMHAGAKACQACLHPGELENALKGAELAQRGRPGGKGGGTGSSPLTLNQKPEDLGPGATAAVSNPNMDHALPGDLMGVGKGEHQVDPTKYAGPAPAGAIASNGEGGEAVWRNDLTPGEREAVKKFFK